MVTDNVGGKVWPCGKEVAFNCIKKGTDARAEGSSVEPLYKDFLCVSWDKGIGLWLWGVEWSGVVGSKVHWVGRFHEGCCSCCI